ncbi:hypothetical protein [Gordonia sp. DT101]
MATAAEHKTTAETLIETAGNDLTNGRVEAAHVHAALANAHATLATASE